MKLTPENRAHIDAKSYAALLKHWRNAPVGDPWFEGETGRYWWERIRRLRAAPGGNAVHVRASKRLWERRKRETEL